MTRPRPRRLLLIVILLVACGVIISVNLLPSMAKKDGSRNAGGGQTSNSPSSATGTSNEALHGLRSSDVNDKTLLMEFDSSADGVNLPRVFCWITTQEKELNNKVRAVNNTWVRRCDGHMYIITKKSNISLPDVIDLGVPDGRNHLTAKTMKAVKHLYTHHLNDFDWFLKGDDDAYFVMENLKFLLSHYDPKQPIYTGHLFKKYHKMGYMSGGAGYVLSRQALKMVVEQGINVKGRCAEDTGDEDVKLGLCLHKVGVASFESIDKFDRETFHPFGALAHIGGPMPFGLDEYDRHPTKIGQECCSQLAISYHYNTPQLIYLIEQMLYRTSVYGKRPKSSAAFIDFFKIGEAPPLPKAPK